MTRIEGENVGRMILFNNIYRWYILTWCSLGLTTYGKCSKYLVLFTNNALEYKLCVVKNIFNCEWLCECVWYCLSRKILDSSELSWCLLEMGVEYYLVCIREGLQCGKGVEQPRGRGRLNGVRETQLFLRCDQSNREGYTDLIICGHKM